MSERSLLDDPSKEPGLVRFVKDEQAEIQKVEWPSRKDTRNLTIVVLALTAFLALILGSLDFVLTWVYGFARTLVGI